MKGKTKRNQETPQIIRKWAFLRPCDTWQTPGGFSMRPAPWGCRGVPQFPPPRPHTLSGAPTLGGSRPPVAPMHSLHGNQTTLCAFNCPEAQPSARSGGEPGTCKMPRAPPGAAVPRGRGLGPTAWPLLVWPVGQAWELPGPEEVTWVPSSQQIPPN